MIQKMSSSSSSSISNLDKSIKKSVSTSPPATTVEESNVIFDDIVVEDLEINERMVEEEITSKAHNSGCLYLHKMQTITIVINGIPFDLDRHQEIMRMMMFRLLAEDFGAIKLHERVIYNLYMFLQLTLILYKQVIEALHHILQPNIINILQRNKTLMKWLERAPDNYREKLKKIGEILKLQQKPYLGERVSEVFLEICKRSQLFRLRQMQVLFFIRY
jgi:hypothetical protein